MKKSISALVALVLAFTASALSTDDLVWTSMNDFPVYGTLVHDSSDSVRYARLPKEMRDTIRRDLADLGTNTAGMYIRFATDASAIGAKWKATKKFNMNHMTAAGIRGLDLYVRTDDGQWTTLSAARPAFHSHSTTAMVIKDMEPAMREYMLYLPLYDGVDSVYIGVDSAAHVVMPRVDSPRAGKPVVMYGTSILQGGCASRPGMVHTSILSRMLDREVVNLGFSGNGRLDPEVAHLIADSDASLVVLDVLPNCKAQDLVDRLSTFVAIIRAKLPNVPIVLVESPIFPVMRFNMETLQTITDKNNTFRAEYEKMLASGVSGLHYFRGEDVLGSCVEGTVDNYHFTDLGFTVFADNLYPLLKSLLER